MLIFIRYLFFSTNFKRRRGCNKKRYLISGYFENADNDIRGASYCSGIDRIEAEYSPLDPINKKMQDQRFNTTYFDKFIAGNISLSEYRNSFLAYCAGSFVLIFGMLVLLFTN